MNRAEMTTILQLIVLGFSIKELFAAKSYYMQQKKKWAIASVCMGIFGCACVLFSWAGII